MPLRNKQSADDDSKVGPAKQALPKKSGRKGPAKTNKLVLAKLANLEQALDLRRSGHTFQQIADKLGYADAKGPCRLINEYIEKTKQQCEQKIEVLRGESLEKLDYYLRSLDVEIKAGNPKAVMAAVAIDKRKATLLGLDKPTQVEHSGTVKTYAVLDASPDCPTWPALPQPPQDQPKEPEGLTLPGEETL
jgi:hypothetical protein